MYDVAWKMSEESTSHSDIVDDLNNGIRFS
jgi:hypothetical protein